VDEKKGKYMEVNELDLVLHAVICAGTTAMQANGELNHDQESSWQIVS
jgi:hypothetical protein